MNVRIISPNESLVMEYQDTESLLYGLFEAAMLNGASIYIRGAKNPLTNGCREIVPVLENKK